MYVYSSGSRAIHAAVHAGRVHSLRALLDAGADPNAADDTGHTPLMQACRLFDAADRYVVVRELLREGADPTRQSDDRMISLHYASFRDTTGIIELLLSKAMATLNQDTGYGGTPLCCAASGGYETSVRRLLSCGRSDNAIWSKKGLSVLVGAVQEGRQEIVRILLDHEVDAVGGLNTTVVPKATWTATRKGHAKILHMLLAVAGEGTRRQWVTQSYSDSTLLYCATSVGSLSVTSVLLSAGTGETARDQHRDYAMDVICARLQVDLATRAAIFRTLRRGPAYRARSWAYSTKAGTDDGDDDVDGSRLSGEGARKDKDWPVVRVTRPWDKRVFIPGFARYSETYYGGGS